MFYFSLPVHYKTAHNIWKYCTYVHVICSYIPTREFVEWWKHFVKYYLLYRKMCNRKSLVIYFKKHDDEIILERCLVKFENFIFCCPLFNLVNIWIKYSFLENEIRFVNLNGFVWRCRWNVFAKRIAILVIQNT